MATTHYQYICSMHSASAVSQHLKFYRGLLRHTGAFLAMSLHCLKIGRYFLQVVALLKVCMHTSRPACHLGCLPISTLCHDVSFYTPSLKDSTSVNGSSLRPPTSKRTCTELLIEMISQFTASILAHIPSDVSGLMSPTCC